LADGSAWTPDTATRLELVTHLESGTQVWFPSSLVWLTCSPDEPGHFQKSSNGQSLGGSCADALLQGLYECIERDQYILRRCSLDFLRVWPPRANFDDQLAAAIESAGTGLKLFLFSCASDISIPVYWAIIMDPSWRACGGWGCHLNPSVAAERAVLEAVQSRAVVIAGARDDLERRDPDWHEQMTAIRRMEALPIAHKVPNWPIEMSAEEELNNVLRRLGPWRERIYYKHIRLDDHLHAVKVQVLGFEQPVMRHWKPLRWHKLRESFTQAHPCTV